MSTNISKTTTLSISRSLLVVGLAAGSIGVLETIPSVAIKSSTWDSHMDSLLIMKRS